MVKGKLCISIEKDPVFLGKPQVQELEGYAFRLARLHGWKMVTCERQRAARKRSKHWESKVKRVFAKGR